MSADRLTMPPVRLHTDAELARDALAAPLLSRAARLARWAGPGKRVGPGGELLADDLAAATAQLGLAEDTDGPAYAAEAWQLALDTGLVEFTEDSGADGAPGAEASPATGATGLATPGDRLALLTGGSPRDVLDIWLAGLETVLADAAIPDLDDLAGALGPDGEVDLDALGWNPEDEADFLDGVLGNLYLLTATDEEADRRPVPLPALAASVIVPEDMDEPSDDILEEVSEAMMRLDDQFRLLEPTGIVVHHPLDERLLTDDDEAPAATAGEGADEIAAEDIARYGMVRLTPLGVFAVRNRLLDAGVDAPAVGDLAGKGPEVLLDALPGYPERAARAEAEAWLAHRAPEAAARELLDAARGDDEAAPLRRLACQQTLALVGPEAEPALREVLGDRHLGGLARVWLAEQGVPDVPEPSQDMVFWLTVDTLAAQLAAEGDSAELRDLVEGLAGTSEGFFETVWRVDHPATEQVLEAMGRLHPDKKAAKAARKAAFKARSRH
ncbi:hypothetical protein IHE55_05335 [Streptomyces pactum]|uniref:Uncharacterized protein n=1 Tax=Streptomyces pactum TaxID=68249 RepID=A0ABS0NGF1_9ACTN|nr:hypothetical protein [Streptomyces pactum]MBH5334256.1 hypothetical protein [Streptomyces pactum]